MFHKKILTIFVFILCILSYHNEVWAAKVRVVDLTNGWQLKNQNGSIEVSGLKIPSGVYSATSKLYGDLLHSYNDVNLRWIAYDNWTYTNTFNVDSIVLKDARFVNLTLHGVDTVAEVRLNNEHIGWTNNMFVRYSFDVLPYLKTENTLEIAITSPIYAAKQSAMTLKAKNITSPPDCDHERHYGECHRNMLRKMQTSFGYDFTLAAPSMGIWKPVTLEYYDVAIMRDIDVVVGKNATHWIMEIHVFLSTGIKVPFFVELTFIAPGLFGSPHKELFHCTFPSIYFKKAIPINDVELWWPNGYGHQKLYPLYFTVNCWLEQNGPALSLKSKSTKSLKVGFRTIKLIEDEVVNGRRFFFRVNGVDIFVKGANYIPAHILPEFADNAEKVHNILKAAHDSHLNMIRVWGGGLYESDFFYSLADTFGLLVWQDMAFSSVTYPVSDDFLESVCIETVQNAQRLSHHASLALFVTNNEVELSLATNKYGTDREYERFVDEYMQLFTGTIKHELRISNNIYKGRAGPLRSTPSNGMEAAKQDLSSNPQDPHYGDVHIWDDNVDGWDPIIYPRARFVSEYGFQSLPITASWLRSMAKSDNLSEIINHRQHNPKSSRPMETLARRHLPLPAEADKSYLECLIYFSQVAQAMATKVATELFRSQRKTKHYTMGALYWQLNDVWVAPTWSSIDYYGNYKLLYYWSKDFMAPTAIIALYDSINQAINLTLVQDEFNVFPEFFNVTMNIYLWSEVYPKRTETWDTLLNGSDAKLKVLPIDRLYKDNFTANNTFVEFILSSNHNVVSRTFLAPSNLSQAVGISDPELKLEISWQFCNAKLMSYSLTIHVVRPAVFVYIEILHPDIEYYKLSSNGFMQMEPIKTVHLEFKSALDCLKLTREHITVKTMNEYIIAARA